MTLEELIAEDKRLRARPGWNAVIGLAQWVVARRWLRKALIVQLIAAFGIIVRQADNEEIVPLIFGERPDEAIGDAAAR